MPKRVRPIEIVGDIALIPLTRGLFATIDAADVGLVSGRNWYALKSKRGLYARTNGRKNIETTRAIMLHRVILSAPDEMLVDHENHDGLDCRRSNLRLATYSQNSANARQLQKTSSGVKGVTWDKNSQLWNAQISVKGRRIGLGYFTEKEDAKIAYQTAARKHFGEFACFDAKPHHGEPD